jgi:hypothetical protein
LSVVRGREGEEEGLVAQLSIAHRAGLTFCNC